MSINRDAIDAIELALNTLGCSQKELAQRLILSCTTGMIVAVTTEINQGMTLLSVHGWNCAQWRNHSGMLTSTRPSAKMATRGEIIGIGIPVPL